MTGGAGDDGDVSLVDPVNARLRRLPDWDVVRAAHVARAADIAPDATLASLAREKTSYRGIGAQRQLTTLFAAAVDQAYLDEICELEALDYLWLGWPVTARDLSGLERLERLSFLKLDSPRHVTDFTPLTRLPGLTHLFVENAKHMDGLEWLAPLHGRLAVLGVEGSLWTMQTLASLAPLAGFGFEALCLTSVRLADKDLTPLASCPNLRHLQCARFAPKPRFEELKALRPDVDCLWFDSYDIRPPMPGA